MSYFNYAQARSKHHEISSSDASGTDVSDDEANLEQSSTSKDALKVPYTLHNRVLKQIFLIK